MYVISVLRIQEYSNPPKYLKKEEQFFEFLQVDRRFGNYPSLGSYQSCTKFKTIEEAEKVFSEVKAQLRLESSNAYDWDTLGIREITFDLVQKLSLSE